MDWQGSEAELEKVIASAPEDLGRDAYWMIFYQNLPAANCQEGCFYVPHFLNFYALGKDYESPNLEGFFWFIDHFREDFERDGLLDPIERRQNLFDFFHRLQRFSAHQDKILRESDINQGYFQYNKRLLPN